MQIKLKSMVIALSLAGIAGMALAGPVSDQMLAQDPSDSWLHTNGNWAGYRYSVLSQVNARNAKDLKLRGSARSVRRPIRRPRRCSTTG